MLVKQGSDRTLGLDRQLACSLAAVAGALNAAAFYAVGFFSANMTGNVSILSDHLATGQWTQAAFYFAIVLTFISGAVFSTVLIHVGHLRKIASIYALCILFEAIMLLPLGAADLWLPQSWHIAAVVLCLAFLLGHQNAIVTRISEARVRTTHVSGMATDIGIEVGLLLTSGRSKDSGLEADAVRSRLRLHVETIVSFLLGGIAGVLLYRATGGGLFWMASAILGALAFRSIVHARRTPLQTSDISANDL